MDEQIQDRYDELAEYVTMSITSSRKREENKKHGLLPPGGTNRRQSSA